MKEVKIYSNFKVFDSIDELSDQIKVLFNKAKLIRESAYSEYSKFSVGAAVLLENGEILCGSNQENASYPSGLCAERTALFYANSKYPKIKIKEIAVIAGSINKINDNPVAPCGSCRQVISEFQTKQNSDIGLYFMGEKGKIIHTDSINNLLPFKFDKSFL
ncbi:MAG: cytidine deaminase [Flavobacteriaceae bacterium]|nr:cytidine deaminase [Flavobacteriaceae bacterium]MBT5771701.1 cytidine deaminase [Flavobacteriaceae bacterium]